MLTDTHAHLFWDSFKEDLNEVLDRAIKANISIIFNVGTDVDTSEETLNQLDTLTTHFKENEIVFYSTVGIHPHDAFKYDNPQKLEAAIQKLEQIYQKNPKKVIGIGECGLDFFFSNNPDFVPNNLTIEQLKQLQFNLFQAQINLAKKLDLPLIVHVRDDRSKNPQNVECWSKALDMVSGYKGILHCYSGLEEVTKRLETSDFSDFLISFAAPITYPKNDYLRKVAKDLPLNKICLETDSPFLPPQSDRGKRNEPQTVKEIATLIAELKEISLEKVATTTTQNIKTLFKLS